MTFTIEVAQADEAYVVERLLQFKLYEGGMEPEPDGLIDWGEPLDTFFTDPNYVPLLFRDANKLVGFALVKLNRKPTGPDGKTPVTTNCIEEFFILPPHRRKGLGTRAVDLIRQRYPGQWMATTWAGATSVGFWRSVAAACPEVNGREYQPDEHKGYAGQHVWIMESNKTHGDDGQ